MIHMVDKRGSKALVPLANCPELVGGRSSPGGVLPKTAEGDHSTFMYINNNKKV